MPTFTCYDDGLGLKRIISGLRPPVPSTPVMNSTSAQIPASLLSDNAAQYSIERSPHGSATWTEVAANLNSSAFPYTDTGLTANGVQYDWRIKAYYGVFTEYGPTTTGTTTALPSPPSAPPTFTTSATDTSITATITAANGATSYSIRISTDNATWTSFTGTLTATGLTASTSYYVQTQGINSAGSSSWSTSITQSTASSAPAQGTVLFSDNFDAQPDFTSNMYSTVGEQKASDGYIMPTNWDAFTQDLGTSYTKPPFQILSADSALAYGATGKAYVKNRSSYSLGWNNWASDSQLVKYFTPVDDVNIEFKIMFPSGFYGQTNIGDWTSKLFRIASFRGTGDPFSGFSGDLGPIALWDYKHDSYGVRNVYSFRGGPWGQNYNFGKTAGIDASENFGSSTAGNGAGGTDPQVPDLVNGGYLINYVGTIDHPQVFGTAGTWTTMKIYVKMNSAPGIADGIWRQYINGVQFRSIENIDWIGASVVLDSITGATVGSTVTKVGDPTVTATIKYIHTSAPIGLYFEPSATATGYTANQFQIGDQVTDGTNTWTVQQVPFMVKWNLFSIGGNDYFQPYPNTDQFQDSYVIDNAIVKAGAPL